MSQMKLYVLSKENKIEKTLWWLVIFNLIGKRRKKRLGPGGKGGKHVKQNVPEKDQSILWTDRKEKVSYPGKSNWKLFSFHLNLLWEEVTK